jgi:EpsI family protein
VDLGESVNRRSYSKFPWHFACTFLLLGGTLAASVLTSRRTPQRLLEPLETIDTQIAGFIGTNNPPVQDRVLQQLRSDSLISRTYRRAGAELDLLVVYYAEQRAGQSMHSPKHCLPGAGWEIWDYGSANVPVQDQVFTVNKYSISNAGQRMLVLYWYQSKGRIVASEYEGKLLLARDALLQNSTAASIVRLIVPDQPGAVEYAKEFAASLIPQLQRRFGS